MNEANLVFRNLEGRGFESANEPWGYEHVGVSFGTAILDFDRDGDLDIVYTNFDAPPSLWRNDLGKGNAVQIRLIGDKANQEAVGAMAIAHYGGRKQAFKILSNRGYLGSDEKLIHFGLGRGGIIEKLEIFWPDGSFQLVRDLEKGKRYTIEKAGVASQDETRGGEPNARFEWKHSEAVEAPLPFVRKGEGRSAFLYPFKRLPTLAKPRLIREDFDGDGQRDSLILRDWESPRILLSGNEISLSEGIDSISGLWEMALVADYNGDDRQDILLGGLGMNNEISYRSQGDGKFVRYLGRFSSEGPELNLNAYEWGKELRLYDGLRDYSEIDGRILKRLGSFRETAGLTPDAFREQFDFKVSQAYEISQLQSGLLIFTENRGARFEPLPFEAQYGRVWDAVVSDLNGDDVQDLVLLLGQVSPHYRSSQDERSFLSIFLGQGDGKFEADRRPVLDKLPQGRMISLSISQVLDTKELEILFEEGRRETFRLRK